MSLRLAAALVEEPQATRSILEKDDYRMFTPNATYWTVFSDTLAADTRTRDPPLERVERAICAAFKHARPLDPPRRKAKAQVLDEDNARPELRLAISEKEAQRCFMDLGHLWEFIPATEEAEECWGALLPEMRSRRDTQPVYFSFRFMLGELIQRSCPRTPSPPLRARYACRTKSRQSHSRRITQAQDDRPGSGVGRARPIA